MFFPFSEARAIEMAPGLLRRTLVSSERLMICRFDLEGGVVIPSHSHSHEQAGYVVSGRIRITVDGESRELGPGDSYSAAQSVPHTAVALDKSVVVDTFFPPREDYR